MIRITNNPVSPDVVPPGKAGGGTPSKPVADVQIPDQVELSGLAGAVSEDRSKKIAAVKAAVDSPGYVPASLPVIRKLVSRALSRTD